MRLSPRRIWGILLRQTYILYHSPPMTIQMVCWPVMNILIWGFMNVYMAEAYGGQAFLAGNLLASAILWEMYVRSSWGLTGCVEEEFVSRNLGSMMATAASLADYIIAFILTSLAKMIFALLIVSSVIWIAFDYSILKIGIYFFVYFPVVIMFGWAMGFLMSTLMFRWGKRAESLCWFTPVMLAFIMCPYYPVSILPQGLQTLSSVLPPSWIFEAMRETMSGKSLPLGNISIAYALVLVWLAVSITAFALSIESARKRGRLLNTGD